MAERQYSIMLIRESNVIELRIYTNHNIQRVPLTSEQLVLLNYLSSQLIWQHFQLTDRS